MIDEFETSMDLGVEFEDGSELPLECCRTCKHSRDYGRQYTIYCPVKSKFMLFQCRCIDYITEDE